MGDMKRQWVVTYTEVPYGKELGDYIWDDPECPAKDHWEVFESEEDARSAYQTVLEEDTTYVATFCKIIQSSDYEGTED